MKPAMVWFCDNPKKTFEQKVADAVEHYERKYCTTAKYCYVNPSNMPKTEVKIGSRTIQIEARKTILKNDYWICEERM